MPVSRHFRFGALHADWPVVRLRELVALRRRWIDLDDAKEYQRVSARVRNQGIEPRDRVSGKEIRTKRQQVVLAHDLLVAEIDAKVGGMGIVPQPLTGGIVSSHYFPFEIASDRLTVDWLDQVVRAGLLQRQVDAVGSTNYAAIRPSDVLSFRIPLPPRSEQEALTSVLAAADEMIEAQRAVAAGARSLLEQCHEAVVDKLFHDTSIRQRAFSSLCDRVSEPVSPRAGVAYEEIGLRSHGKGIFLKGGTTSEIIGDKRVFQVQPGCIVFNIVFAWEGAVAVTTDEHAHAIASHRFPMYRARDAVSEQFLYWLLTSRRGVHLLGLASPGGAGRNRTLGQKALERTKLPVPSLAAQRAIVSLLRALQQKSALENELLGRWVTVRRGLLERVMAGAIAVTPRLRATLVQGANDAGK